MSSAVKPGEDRSAAACKYITEAIKGLTTLNTAVCTDAGTPPPGPVPPTLAQADIEKWLKAKAAIAGNDFLKGATVTVDPLSAGSFIITNASESTQTFTVTGKMVLDDEKDNIAVALSGAADKTMAGGRRGKRSARRSFKGGRRSRKGGRKSRRSKGSKGRKSRGRTIKGGAKMSKELKAWMKRQKKATGVAPISKKTIDAAKTTSKATGSEQRSDSSKHVAAKQRNF